VQLDRDVEFDRLWRFAKTRMLHRSGDHEGYFCWKASIEGQCLDDGAAPDGEEYFAMALLFAAHRWGVTTYLNDANTLLRAMLHKPVRGLVGPMFDKQHKMVVFSPVGGGRQLTDPSYHLPAFYHLFSLWGPAEDRATWAAIRDTSRDYFLKARHPQTCLSPEYAHFDGRPHPGYNAANNRYDKPEQQQSRNDAWRVVFNWSLDHAWFAADPRQPALSNCLLGYFADPARGGGIRKRRGVYSAEYWQYNNLDGRLTVEGLPNLDPKSGGVNWKASAGQIAMNATGVLAAAADTDGPLDFVHSLWGTEPTTGQYRYYDGLLYTMGTLAVAGRFRIFAPPAPTRGTNVIVDGGFDRRLEAWQVQGAAEGAIDTTGGVATVRATQATRLQQRVALAAGKRYRLEFDARLTQRAEGAVTVTLQSAQGTPYRSAQVPLSRTLRNYSVAFGLPGTVDGDARLSLAFGAEAGAVEIDNITLIEEPASP
jgi:oligosaccharide reducing-end xylanase